MSEIKCNANDKAAREIARAINSNPGGDEASDKLRNELREIFRETKPSERSRVVNQLNFDIHCFAPEHTRLRRDLKDPKNLDLLWGSF